MSYASRAGRARTSSRNPQAHAICDRCGGRYNHVDLTFQHDWAGAGTINKRLLVCHQCLDNMQPQLRAIILPPDPVPILNPRPERFEEYEVDRRVTINNTVNLKTGIPVYGGDTRTLMNDSTRVVQQTGFANGSLNNFPGTDPNAPGDNDPGLPYGNTTVPQAGFYDAMANPWDDRVIWNDGTNWNE